MNLAPIEQCTQCSQRVINLPSSKFITEYFKKKAVHAHCTVSCNVTLLEGLGLKLITYFCLVRTVVLFHTENTARHLKGNSPLLFLTK